MLLQYLFAAMTVAIVYSETISYPSIALRQASTSSKAGLAWPNGPWENIDQYRSSGKVQWYYTWGPSAINTNLEFVPMLWGPPQVSEWQHTIQQTIKQRHVTHVLGFNEPQQAGQSNMSPGDAATLWKEQIEPLKTQGIRLGSPAPSSAPSGRQWLLDFLGACGAGCTVDFVALHWYDVNSTAFIDYLYNFHDTFQRPIWVTEWACQNFNQADEQCSAQDVIDFMNATQSFMDTTDWVERYAWFGAMKDMSGVNQDNSLMDASGRINALGEQYIGAIVPNISTDYQPGVVHGGNGTGPYPAMQGDALSESVPALNTVVMTTMAAVTVALFTST